MEIQRSTEPLPADLCEAFEQLRAGIVRENPGAPLHRGSVTATLAFACYVAGADWAKARPRAEVERQLEAILKARHFPPLN